MGASSCSSCSKAEGPTAEADAEAPKPFERKKRVGFNIADLVADNRGKLEDFYSVDRQAVLGEGTFSSVFRCANRDTGQTRAVKIIQRKLLRNVVQAEHEVQITRELDHPNIVRLVEFFEDSASVRLVLELYTGGELFDRIIDNAPFKDPMVAHCLFQMLRAVAYLHGHSILHRDLKAENWMMADEKPILDNTLKLVDFGLARRLGPLEFARTKTGSPYYVAPEVLAGKYNHRADIWSIGVLGYMMLSGTPPFTGANTEEVLKTVETVKPFKCLEKLATSSSESRKFMQAILERDLRKRPSASTLLKDTWFQKSIAKISKSQGKHVSGDALQARQAAFDAAVAKMSKFKVEGQLERLALTAVASQMSREGLRCLEQAFLDMDTNYDGALSVEEIAEALQRIGMKENERDVTAKRLVETLDGDGNGVVDFSEFVVANIDYQLEAREQIGWKAFKVFDLDGSGFIERVELTRLLGSSTITENFGQYRASDEMLDEMYRELDKNGDGKIDFQEFMHILHRLSCEAKP